MGKLEDDILYREIFMSNKSSGGGGGITPTGTKEINITENGTVTEDVTNYASANIVTNIEPYGVGSLDITENGEHDVSGKATAVVNVPDASLETLRSFIEGYRFNYRDDELTKIRDYAFYGSGIINLFTNNVSDVGSNAFENCKNLTIVELKGATSIGSNAFGNCKNLTIVELKGATSIGSSAFLSCTNLKKCYLDSCQNIGADAFHGCVALANIKIPNVNRIEDNAFYDCIALRHVKLPNVTYIGSRAFNSCSVLDYIELPNVTVISGGAFAWCKALDHIDLPVIEWIYGDYTFRGCENLKYIKIGTQDSTEVARTDGGLEIPTDTKIYVPDSLIDEYKNGTNWSKYASQIYPLSEFTE